MILIIDDDPTILSSLRLLLSHSGYSDIVCASSPDEAIGIVRGRRPDLVLMDMNFSRSTSGAEGIVLLQQMHVFQPGVPVILMTAWGSIDLAVEGMKAGAFDFITKPWDNRRLLDRLATAIKLSVPQKPVEKAGIIDRSGIVGQSAALSSLLDTVGRVAPTNASVLISGESGTGKELIAEAIHRNSLRAGKPFVKVNLGGISQSLFESEMFGHKKGAFTGAVADRIGRFEAADGGTIFLDEIGDLDAASQVKMLRVLQEQTFEPLGSSRPVHVDVRIICATNADLPAMVSARQFREDLFYRINLVTLKVPPLRERPDDIPALVRHFALNLAASLPGRKEPEITGGAMKYLASLPYPGNIRELKNMVERTILMSGKTSLEAEDFSSLYSPGDYHPDDSQEESGTLDSMERARIARVLKDSGGNISRTAAALGISRAALYRRIEKYGLQ